MTKRKDESRWTIEQGRERSDTSGGIKREKNWRTRSPWKVNRGEQALKRVERMKDNEVRER